MWALRRTSFALKSQTFSTVAFRACCAKHGISGASYADKTRFCNPLPQTFDGSLLLKRHFSGAHHFQNTSKHGFSSLAGTRSSGEEDDDDLEDGFSELDTSSTDVTQAKDVEDEDKDDDELISEPELSEEEDNDMAMEVSDAETEPVKKPDQQRRVSSALFKAVMDSPTLPVKKALDKWLEKGDSISVSDVSMAMLDFRKRRMYMKALQLSEWLESRKQIEFSEKDYSSRVDLVAKVNGLEAAESYVQKIPKPSRGELVYRTLLANCVRLVHVKKAEQVFNKMKDLKFPITPFACNQLLLLYKRTDRKKVADVLLLMEKENVKPTLFTYRMLIDIKGQVNDIDGMEKIVETMKSEDVEPDSKAQAVLARYYIWGGLKEKAIAILHEMEGNDLEKNRGVCSFLLPLYAALGSADDVRRVWEVCEPNPRVDEWLNAIDAWGKLKKVDEAEAVFDQMSKRLRKIPARHYSAMLDVYANNKMLSKGKNLVRQMAESGCQIGPFTWDALVKLYIEAGEVEKADSVLLRGSEQSQIKPLFNTYMMIMEQYARRGDVHNAEKMFHRMRQDGYVSRMRQYHALLQAYVNAKAPAYGIRERMKADNLFPNKSLAAQLAQVDAFKKTAVSDLLD